MVAAGALLTACGDEPAATSSSATPSPSPSPARSASPSADTTSPGPVTPSEEAAHLKRDAQQAFQDAMAAYPGADLDVCTTDTALDDTACGAALRAAQNVAADTARRLWKKQPKYADMLYGPVLLTADAVRDAMGQTTASIPCYGLSDAPEPPAPLRAEAQGICAEAVSIYQAKWQIFLTTVQP